MKELINLKEHYYVVRYHERNYAINGMKHPVENLETETIVEIHPVSRVGIVNYNEIVKAKGSSLRLPAIQ